MTNDSHQVRTAFGVGMKRRSNSIFQTAFAWKCFRNKLSAHRRWSLGWQNTLFAISSQNQFKALIAEATMSCGQSNFVTLRCWIEDPITFSKRQDPLMLLRPWQGPDCTCALIGHASMGGAAFDFRNSVSSWDRKCMNILEITINRQMDWTNPVEIPISHHM
jgi:hypothetical protein